MTPEEIEQEIVQLNRMLKKLACVSNDLWEQKSKLRNDYKALTGKDI